MGLPSPSVRTPEEGQDLRVHHFECRHRLGPLECQPLERGNGLPERGLAVRPGRDELALDFAAPLLRRRELPADRAPARPVRCLQLLLE